MFFITLYKKQFCYNKWLYWILINIYIFKTLFLQILDNFYYTVFNKSFSALKQKPKF